MKKNTRNQVVTAKIAEVLDAELTLFLEHLEKRFPQCFITNLRGSLIPLLCTQVFKVAGLRETIWHLDASKTLILGIDQSVKLIQSKGKKRGRKKVPAV